ncbi:MAG: beta-lactamase family protein [Gemmatimonadetes bacterium]|nr:beta-lactamase family protein [Gemmatimonadota bacterium]MBT7552552.1 beta-lactamase family protein [Gemmatimonadota bacterium]
MKMKTVNDPEAVGFLREGLEVAHGLLVEAVEAGELLGGVLQVARKGVALPVACFGRREVAEDGDSVEADTIFLIASITKPIVCAAVVKLVEQGRLCLDDRVVQYVPEFAEAGKERVTIRHLLTHTSGLPDMIPENHQFRAKHRPLADFVARICELELLFAPGTRISYQSAGMAMLGEIVERLTGQILPEVLRAMFFAPLGLVDTSLGRQEDRREREAEIRLPDQGDGGGDGTDWHWNSDYWRNFSAPWGGMLTTAAELMVLCQVFLAGGVYKGVRVLSGAGVAAMTRDQTVEMADLSEQDKLRQRRGLGWRVGEGDLSSSRVFGHGGATGTEIWVDPESEVACVLLTNDPQGAGPLRPRIANAVAAAVL